jgi:TetR/AcrR family transcriptional regulator
MVKKIKDLSTEERIVAAARNVFLSKGLAGARMQDIADEAGINKALLHYYFRSKEKLFDMIFMEAAQKLFPKINFIFESNMPLFEKIEHFADEYITVMLENPYLPSFVLNEINQDPISFFKKLNEKFGFPDPSLFLTQIEKEIKRGNIKRINPVQLLMNMLSLCIFPFMAKPMLQLRARVGEKQFREFMEQRKKEVPQFIIDAIRK